MHNRQQSALHERRRRGDRRSARAVDRAMAAGVAWENTIVDPGIGFGKTAEQNLAVLHDLQP